LQQDYVRTARAKGLSEVRVILRHVLKNSFIPVVTTIGLMAGGLLTGTVVVEVVFAWPGMGRLLVEGILSRDYPVVQGLALVLGVWFVLINLAVDISYAYLDPRIRYQ
jgi:peptide/nickel transport system permease protein